MILSLQPQKADSFRFAPPSRKTGVLKAFWGYVRSSEVSFSNSNRSKDFRVPEEANRHTVAHISSMPMPYKVRSRDDLLSRLRRAL